MPYNFVGDSIHRKKLCRRLSSSEVQFSSKTSVLRFETPYGGPKGTYEVHLRFIGKRSFDFLCVN